MGGWVGGWWVDRFTTLFFYFLLTHPHFPRAQVAREWIKSHGGCLVFPSFPSFLSFLFLTSPLPPYPLLFFFFLGIPQWGKFGWLCLVFIPGMALTLSSLRFFLFSFLFVLSLFISPFSLFFLSLLSLLCLLSLFSLLSLLSSLPEHNTHRCVYYPPGFLSTHTTCGATAGTVYCSMSYIYGLRFQVWGWCCWCC